MRTLNELDRAALTDLAAGSPKSAIRVMRGHFDGAEPKPFGFVPNDWDGTVKTYEFRMVVAR